MARRRFSGYAWTPGILLIMVLVAPVAAGTGTWTTNGPFATGLGNQVIYALAISTDGSGIYCGTGSGSVFSYTFEIAALVANFTGTPVSGTAPLTVAFTDTSSGSPVAWSWDFGDGGSSTDQNPTHTYTGTGSFSVSLTATNGTYSNTTTRNNYITVTTVPVTTTTTAVPTTTVPVTTVATEGGSDDTSADSGRGTSFVVTSPGTPTGGTMTFAVNEPLRAGSTDYSYAIISVDMLLSETLGTTDLIVTDAGATSHAPDDRTVAGIAAISPIAVNPSAISSGTITFAVSGTWLANHGLTSSDIVLMRFRDGAWAELSTTYQYVDGNTYYFTATTPGFSYFAIAARTSADAADTTGMVTTPTAAPRAAGSTGAAMTTSVVKTIPSHVSAAVTTPAAVPAASGTNAGGSSGFPVTVFALFVVGIMLIIGAVWYIRRWWIRRQNPALFRKYD